MEKTKKLYRSRNRVIGGVAGGLAEYFDVDVVLVRILFLVLLLIGGGGLLGYIILWIVIPSEPLVVFKNTDSSSNPDSTSYTVDDTEHEDKTKNNNTAMVAGILLIIFGLFFLANRVLPWFNLHDYWPLLLIIGGVFIIQPDLLKSKK